MWLYSTVGKASHGYRGGHRFKSCWSRDFFSGFFFPIAYCVDYSSVNHNFDIVLDHYCNSSTQLPVIHQGHIVRQRWGIELVILLTSEPWKQMRWGSSYRLYYWKKSIQTAEVNVKVANTETCMIIINSLIQIGKIVHFWKGCFSILTNDKDI